MEGSFRALNVRVVTHPSPLSMNHTQTLNPNPILNLNLNPNLNPNPNLDPPLHPHPHRDPTPHPPPAGSSPERAHRNSSIPR